MPIHGTLTYADYLAAQRLFYRPSPLTAIVLIAVTVALVLGGYKQHNGAMVLFPFYMLAVLAIYVPIRGWVSFRQNKALSEPMAIEVRDDGIFFQMTHSSGLLPWSHIHKWKSNQRISLIYRTSHMFHLIPRRFFPTNKDREDFLRTLMEKTRAAP